MIEGLGSNINVMPYVLLYARLILIHSKLGITYFRIANKTSFRVLCRIHNAYTTVLNGYTCPSTLRNDDPLKIHSESEHSQKYT